MAKNKAEIKKSAFSTKKRKTLNPTQQKALLISSNAKKNKSKNIEDYDDLTLEKESDLKSTTLVDYWWDCMCCRKKKTEKELGNNESGKEVEDYLEMTNENDYTDYPRLSSLTALERQERI